jgi:hypothetical protein
MRESCRQPALAERAFYRFPRGGQTVSGPSIVLARELARIWGNLSYGIAELRRDDDYGQSEMIAFAWDVQTNAKASSAFIAPHRRDTKDGPKALVDMRDIYESNANLGARRVREMVFSILPAWFTEEAKAVCSATLEDGGGKPLAQRVIDAIDVFAAMGVTEAQLAQKLGSESARWTAPDVAQLGVIYTSLKNGEISKEDEFPPAQSAGRVTAADITEKLPPEDKPAKARTRAVKTAKLPAEDLPAGEPGVSDEPGSASDEQVGAVQDIYEQRFGWHPKREHERMLGASETIIGRVLAGPRADRAHANLSADEAVKLADTLSQFDDSASLSAHLNARGGDGEANE